MEDWRSQLKFLAPALGGVALAIAVFAGLRVAGVGSETGAGAAPKVGDTVPEFEATDMDGARVSSAALRGSAVFLNFWATWCPPCVEEMPVIQQLHERYRDRGLRVIAMNVDAAPPDTVRRFLAKHKLSIPVLLDPGGAISRQFGTYKYPETYLLDPSGKIHAKLVGPRAWTQPPFDQMIEALLKLVEPRPGGGAAPADGEKAS